MIEWSNQKIQRKKGLAMQITKVAYSLADPAIASAGALGSGDLSKQIAPAPTDSQSLLDNELFEAVKRGSVEDVALAIAKGASGKVHFGGKQGGQTALMRALRAFPHARTPLVAALLPVSDPMARDDNGWTAFMHAANQGHLTSLQILAPVSDTRAVNARGRNALMVALAASLSVAGKKAMVDFLAPLTDFSQTSATGQTALLLAAPVAPAEILAQLALLCDTEARDSKGRTAMTLVAGLRSAAEVEALGPFCDLNAQNAKGETPAMIAAKRLPERNEGVAWLVERSDPAIVNLAGETIHGILTKKKAWGILDSLAAKAGDAIVENLALELAAVAGPATRARLEALFLKQTMELAQLRAENELLRAQVGGAEAKALQLPDSSELARKGGAAEKTALRPRPVRSL